MPSLASIPETSSTKLATTTKRSSLQSSIAFERARPRSRVVVLSRQPSRVRKRFRHLTPPSGQAVQARASQQNEDNAERSKESADTARPSSSNQAIPLKHAISDISDGQCVPFTPSEESVNLDAFPLPPSAQNGWPLFNDTPRQVPLPTGTATTYKQPGDAPLARHTNRDDCHPLGAHPPDHHRVNSFEPPITIGHQSRTRKRDSIDPVLVEAITHSVAEQLRLYSMIGSPKSPRKPTQPTSSASKEPSRTSSQRQALDRFTRDLQRYAENVSAAGKVPIFTSTPSKSSGTVRTVSALLPYRPEFRAAGLAVTSRDQAQHLPEAILQPPVHRQSRKKTRAAMLSRLGGLDGKQDKISPPSTEVDFMDPNSVDIWRQALIENVPPRRHTLLRRTEDSSAAGCLPWFSSKQPPRHRDIDEANMEIADVEASKSKPIEAYSSAPATKSSRKKGLRPKGYTIPQASQDPTTSHNNYYTQGRMAALHEPRRPEQHLRRRSKTLAQLQSIAQSVQRKEKRRDQSPQPRHRNENQPLREDTSKGVTPLDSLPQYSSKLDLHRFAQRQYQSLPFNQYKKPLVDLSSAPPSPPKLDRRAASFPNKPRSTRRYPEPSTLTSRNKTALAALEIARHDHGPYPERVPKPRPSIGISNLQPRIPSRKSSIRRLRPKAGAAPDRSSVLDSDVLEGLRIATTAACDRKLDNILHEKTGIHIRHFLADLIQIDSYSTPKPGETVQQLSKRRRSQIRQLKQQVRKSREIRRPNAIS